MNFYIADTHFDHKNVLAFDNRPFSSVEEMNNVLIQNWNKVVGPGDHVYILGDFHWGKAKDWSRILSKLSGNKHLIRGNHDLKMPIAPEVRKHFVDVADYREIKDGDQHIVLCHYPMPAFKNMYYGWLHFYGHVHNTAEHNMIAYFCRQVEEYYEFPQRAFNVGCMMPYMNYTPRTMKEIITGGITYGMAGRAGAETEAVTEETAKESET